MTFRITKDTSDQEIFDYVVNHLRAQGRRSVDSEFQCAYRSEDGCSCAIGCLIPDDLYTPSLESLRIPYIAKDSTFDRQAEYLGIKNVDRHDMLDALQRIHDEGKHWKPGGGFLGESVLSSTARRFGLVYKPPSPAQLETA